MIQCSWDCLSNEIQNSNLLEQVEDSRLNLALVYSVKFQIMTGCEILAKNEEK